MSSRTARATPVAMLMFALLQGCALTPKPTPELSPLVVSNCPPLTPLADDSFGATTNKLIEVVGTYYRCREAALGSPGSP